MLIDPIRALSLLPLHLHNLPCASLLVVPSGFKRLRIPLRWHLRLGEPAQSPPAEEMGFGAVRIQGIVVRGCVFLRAPLEREFALRRLTPLLLRLRGRIRVRAHVPATDLGRLGVFRDGTLLLTGLVMAARRGRRRWRHITVVPTSLGPTLLAPHSGRTSGGFTVTVGFGTCGRATTTTSGPILLVLLILLLISSTTAAATVSSISALWWGLGVKAGLTLGGFSFPDLFDLLLALFEGDGFALGFCEEFGLWLSSHFVS